MTANRPGSMHNRLLLSATLLILSCGFAPPSHAAAPAAGCAADAKWNDPATPQHIYGNTWYVGTCALSSILITSDAGAVLIDGDTEQAPPLIAASIHALGFRIEDVHYILNSHAHPDHAGGIAQLQKVSGAVVAGLAANADALEHGRGDRSDPQFLIAKPFPPVTSVRRIKDGETLQLGAIAITAHATPGHTPGSTTWTWDSCEADRCLHMVYADSLSPIADDVFRYSDDKAHPGVLKAFRSSITTVAGLPCDILLTPHPGASHFWSRIGPAATAALIDKNACRAYADDASAQLDTRIAKEKAGPPGSSG